MEKYFTSFGLLFVLLLFFGIGSFAVSETKGNESCRFGQMECNITKKCIPFTWRCDGDFDCGNDDMSDEENCPQKTCANQEFNCVMNGSCISLRWICDGEPDCDGAEDEDAKLCSKTDGCNSEEFVCGDGNCISKLWKCDGVKDCENGNDEHNCTKTCRADMFTCNNGDCVSLSWKCDGDHDCLDKSDEDLCSEKVCKKEEFKCVDSNKCIDLAWKCDGDFDCADHSDEPHNCSLVHQKPGDNCTVKTEFKCKTSGECIHSSWKCDGDPDCTDGSDEGNECKYECRDDQFMCKNNICIAKVLQCDHSSDCMDNSDEFNCTVQTTCADRGEFDCYGDGSYCIAHDKVCDGHDDCQHREDEEAALCKHKNPCSYKTCGADAHCENQAFVLDKPIQAVCVCNSGYQWDNATKHCKDIDECDQRGVCSQICTNTKGSYKCDCLPGYQLEKHYFCKAYGELAWLYFTNRRDIRRLRTDSHFMEIVVDQTYNSIALDVDVARNIMFWTDSQLEKIYRVNNTTKEKHIPDHEHQTVIDNDEGGAFAADGIAVDWLYQNIYWTDAGSDRIKVADYSGNKTKTLISSDLEDPRAIVVDPENGYMYWTDWGAKPKIERSGMDGNNREVVVEETDGLQWPNGLTIDYISQRLYWIDAKLHRIGSANVDGSDPVHILVDAHEIIRPFSISVFEDNLYWTDWSSNSILTVDKVTGRNIKRLSMGSYSVMDIKVIHMLKQSKEFQLNASHLCESANCEYLCIPTAHVDSKRPKAVTCACADDSKLNTDGRTCNISHISGSTLVPGTPAPGTQAPSSSLPPQQLDSTYAPTTKGTAQTQPSTTGLPISERTEYTTDITQHGQSQSTASSQGHVAIIGAVISCVVLSILFAVGYIAWRRFRVRNTKSMNFDNPVYRKTTTNEDYILRDEPQAEPLTLHQDV